MSTTARRLVPCLSRLLDRLHRLLQLQSGRRDHLVMPYRAGRVRSHRECHLYFARGVTFLPCADTAAVPKLKNFETNEHLNYAVIPTGWIVAEYACAMPLFVTYGS